MLPTKQFKTLRCIQSLKVMSYRPFHGPPKQDEYVKEAQYPEIPKYNSQHEKEYDSLKDQMKKLKTVEEKQIFLNKPKYYGWYSCVINPSNVKTNSLDFLQYVTNTTIIDDDLPESMNNLTNIASKEAELLEPIVKKHLVMQSVIENGFEVKSDAAPYQDRRGNKYVHCVQS